MTRIALNAYYAFNVKMYYMSYTDTITDRNIVNIYSDIFNKNNIKQNE